MQLEFHQLDRRLENLRVRYPAQQRRLVASLAEAGQQTPIIVIEQQGRYVVIDGHKRIAALAQLGRDTVEAAVWEMSEAEALVLERSLRTRQPETALEQGWLLVEMESRLGCSLEELARRFDRSATWVASRIALVETLPLSVQQLVREGKLAAATAMRYLAPVARINVEHCQRLAHAIAGAAQPWTTRQTGELYRAWRDASRAMRERIVASPELYRKVQQPARSLEKQLNQITAIAQRALADLESPPPDNASTRRKISHAIELLSALKRRVEEEPEPHHVDPSPTHRDSRAACAEGAQARDRTSVGDLAAKRPPSTESELGRPAEDRTGRESFAVPLPDPRTVAGVQGQSCASP